MLGKLIKHEFRATGRILLPVYLVMLLTAALVRGFQVLTEQTAGEFMRALAVLSVLLFSAAVFGGSILAFVLMIYRFYKNLMTDEGYLMFTLPVTTGQLIWSKMIVSAVWLLATAAMDVLSMFISVFDSAAWRDIFQLPGLLWQQLREYAGNLGLIPAEIVVLVLLAALVCFLKFYAAIALGHSFTNRKMLLSVAFFAAFSVAEQIAVGGADRLCKRRHPAQLAARSGRDDGLLCPDGARRCNSHRGALRRGVLRRDVPLAEKAAEPAIKRTDGRAALSRADVSLCGASNPAAEEEPFLHERDDIVHDHAEAEHEDDRLHVERDGAGAEEGVERAVIAEVDEQRIDRVITCLPQPDKDIVDDGAARVGDIERDEPHGDGKRSHPHFS